MMTTLGAELVAVAEGRVAVAATVAEGLRQQAGYAHAALIFALGDTAAGYAALTVMPPDVDVLTVEMKINLLSPGAGRLVAEGRVLKPGRRLVVVAADVWSEVDGKRTLAAVLQGTMIPVA
ncbi:MAG: PaaI family thioesterase [Pseudooceanicola sp.]|nr:PaaI family thioesterase [Pseudooceanicola sp.]